MTGPCVEIERIVRTETLVEELNHKTENMDKKLDVLLETVGSLKNNKGFIGGIAATGWLLGVLMVDAVKPFAKPLVAAALALLK